MISGTVNDSLEKVGYGQAYSLSVPQTSFPEGKKHESGYCRRDGQSRPRLHHFWMRLPPCWILNGKKGSPGGSAGAEP